jgi:protein phosphatase
MTPVAPRLTVGQLSHPGTIREVNEDSFGWFTSQAGELLVVADGLGGYAGGKTASQTAVEAFHRYVSSHQEEPSRLLSQALLTADARISQKALANPELAGMGSTIVSLLIKGYEAYIIHAGDSRLYRLRRNNLELLTKDHSYVQELIDSGQLSVTAAKKSDQRHIVTQSLGGGLTQEALAVQKINCRSGDLFLLCSDGLTEMVTEQKIKAILVSRVPIQTKAEKLVYAAIKGGGTDNITVQLAQLDAPYQKTAPIGQDQFQEDFAPRSRFLWPIAITLLALIVGAFGYLIFWPEKEITPEGVVNQSVNLTAPANGTAPIPPRPDNQTDNLTTQKYEEGAVNQSSTAPANGKAPIAPRPDTQADNQTKQKPDEEAVNQSSTAPANGTAPIDPRPDTQTDNQTTLKPEEWTVNQSSTAPTNETAPIDPNQPADNKAPNSGLPSPPQEKRDPRSAPMRKGAKGMLEGINVSTTTESPKNVTSAAYNKSHSPDQKNSLTPNPPLERKF